MSSLDSTVQFIDDKRGVSAVIGFILMFGILILALTTYQAAVVPQQNAQTEFEHFEDNRDELIEFRNAVSTAGQTKSSQFPSIKLGTQYQSRTFTINPAPPSGTLQTSQPYNITLTDGDTTENVSTRFVEYRPGYREISVGSTWYEHSVLYLDERETSGQNIIEDQNIVTSSGTVRITALQNEFQSTRNGRVTVELYPTNDSEFPDFDGNVEVKLPTRLDEDYWEEEIRPSIYDDVESYPGEPDVNRLLLEVDSDDLEMNTVGIQDEPNEGSVDNVPDRGSGGNGEEGTEVNPGGPNDVRLVGVKKENREDGEDGDAVRLTFRNSGEQTDIVNGRVSFYTGVNNPNEADIYGSNKEDRRATWTIGDDLSSLSPPITLPGNQDTEVVYKFDDNYNTNQDFFITTLTFSNNKRATYFVGGQYDFTNGEGENGGGMTQFESVFVSNMDEDQSDTEQIYEFSLDGDLEEDEEVTIDLDGAFVDGEVEYPSSGQADVTVIDGSGDTDYDATTGQEEAEITYSAGDGGDSSGETVQIELSGVEVFDETEANEYEVTFVYEEDENIDRTTTFEIE